MDSELKQKLREILLDCYGVDIEDAVCHFSTQNYAFIFPDKPYMIRVSMTPKKSRKEILSELLWIDDLKQFKNTICEPNTSLHGKLLEEFVIDDITYRASMFRTARGNVKLTQDMTPMFFICVGDLLGTIHSVSTDERELGIKYQRRSMSDIFAELRERVSHKLSPEVRGKIIDIETQVNALPQKIGQYGICHGDFHLNNFFVEDNNIWLFDFDGCAYANYLYDVASFVQACFLQGYGSGKDCRHVLNEEMLHYFKIGYELNKKTCENYWDNLELFIAYRTAFTVMSLAEIDKLGIGSLESYKQFFSYIIMQDSILDGMTQILKMRAKNE